MYKTLRRMRIAFSVGFMLLLTYAIIDTTFGLTHLGQWLVEVQLVPAILGSAAAWVVLWVVLTLCYGRVYCSTVCPMGTLQDAVSFTARSVRRGHHYRYALPADWLRIPIGVIVAVCLIGGVSTVVTATDPFTRYSQIVQSVARPAAIGFGGMAVSMLVLLGVSACASSHGRIVCNTLCPAGAFLALVARQALYAVDIDTDKCIHCNKCVDVCKAQCIKMPDSVVDHSRCVMCLDCTAVCPNQAITVRRGRHHLSIPMMQKLTPTTQNHETISATAETHT